LTDARFFLCPLSTPSSRSARFFLTLFLMELSFGFSHHFFPFSFFRALSLFRSYQLFFPSGVGEEVIIVCEGDRQLGFFFSSFFNSFLSWYLLRVIKGFSGFPFGRAGRVCVKAQFWTFFVAPTKATPVLASWTFPTFVGRLLTNVVKWCVHNIFFRPCPSSFFSFYTPTSCLALLTFFLIKTFPPPSGQFLPLSSPLPLSFSN